MAGPLLVGAEGVIIIPDDDSYAAGRPIVEGLELIMQLSHFPTTRTAIMVGLVDPEPADYFCKINGLPKAQVLPIRAQDRHDEPWMAQWYCIERERASGPINMVITSYPEVWKRCMGSHQPALMFARRGSLGTLEPRPTWEELHAKVIRSRDAAVEALNEPDQDQ
jgi:hypothetical protein